jgi:hypothetical protein
VRPGFSRAYLILNRVVADENGTFGPQMNPRVPMSRVP